MSRGRGWSALGVLSCLALGGCPPPDPEPSPPPTPACPTFLAPEQVGQVPSPPADELSGLAVGPDGRLWVHNDSGPAEVYALDPGGALRSTWTLPGVTVRDWEDLAIGPGPDGAPWVYVGDIGDNARVRDTVTVHRFPLPTGDAGGTVQPERVELRYPDGPRDAETLLVDPTDGALIVVSKEADGDTGFYRLDMPRPGLHTLQKVGSLRFGKPPLGVATQVTGGDLGPRGLVLRTYLNEAYVWPAAPGDGLVRLLERAPCPVLIAAERQGEAIGWSERGLLTVSEGPEPPLFWIPQTP